MGRDCPLVGEPIEDQDPEGYRPGDAVSCIQSVLATGPARPGFRFPARWVRVVHAVPPCVLVDGVAESPVLSSGVLRCVPGPQVSIQSRPGVPPGRYTGVDLLGYPVKTHVLASLNTINSTVSMKQNKKTVSTSLINDASNSITIDRSAYHLYDVDESLKKNL